VIHLAELDLAQPSSAVPLTSGPTRILVRWGREVLDEVELPAVDAYWSRRLHEEQMLRHAPRILALARASPPAVAAPTISVVLCTRDRAQLLTGALDALKRLEVPPAEVIVVDNAPTTDATALVCRSRPVRRVVEPVPGLDRARNRGWREARGEVVAYVDDDARVDRWWTASLGAAFGQPGVGGVTGLVLAAELDTYAQRYFELRLGGMRKGFVPRVFGPGHDPGLESFRVGVGTNMAFRRPLLEQLGGFDPRLDVGTATRGGGDLDMFARAVGSGATVVYEPSVLVRHLHRVDRAGLLAQLRDNGTSFRALLQCRAEEGPATARTVQRYLWRWHLRRHGRDVLRAARRADFLGVQAALAEAAGSRDGVRAWRRACADEAARAAAPEAPEAAAASQAIR
jgi:GT2 family glycosyltransferase